MATKVVVVEEVDERVVDDDLWPLYRSVFGDFDDLALWREQVWDRHRMRAGFRLALAREGGRLLGFGYGYTGDRGQWWTDTARTVLLPEVAADWLGGHFEVVSLGVAESSRGAGVGHRLMEALTTELPQPRWLLMTTADGADPSRRLYRSTGWAVIGPGFSDEQVIMGRSWPAKVHQ